ncbi:protoporphyrinogen oxidase [Erythromicrobium ramosum]|uniref:NAD(P)-binding protein n=1 Tax=Erythrobacter ramosus TaxID=35811 RepID=A0A6I4UM69_9SPHN|nr:FAD-dependent oxidoreductase [Erythrobacter ramosus]MBB3777204.1 protoporphyrinogen oxidase [Erythrobacter ramosus]MXP39962.1 NAD(P)-binding protein [Erythrobacter ramosus]
MEHNRVVIIGGGISGLACAHYLGADVALFEKDKALGGCLRTDKKDGYLIDRTGHLLHFRHPVVQKLMFDDLGIEWLEFDRKAEVQLLSRRIPYPIQYNLHALPETERRRCLEDFLARGEADVDAAVDFEHWSSNSYGNRLHELFFEPYNRKLWQTDLDTITCDWVQRFVPLPDEKLIIDGARSSHERQDFGYNARFSYPHDGGSGAIIEALARRIASPIHLEAELVAIDLEQKVCEFANGRTVSYDFLVNTMPVTRLLALAKVFDSDLLAASRQFRHNSIFYFAFGFQTQGDIPDLHWLYVPEEKYCFYRAGLLSNYSPAIAPAGSALVCAEIGCPGDSAASMDPHLLRNRALEELTEVGIVQPDWKLEMEHAGSIDCAYVIFDQHRQKYLPLILDYLRKADVLSMGRYGAWDYGSMGDAVLEAYETATLLRETYC